MQRSKEEDALLSKIANTEATLCQLKERLHEEQLKRAGVAIGDVVLNRKGARFIVREISHVDSRKCWVHGSPTKGDGSWSKAIRALYTDWTLEPSEA